WNFDGSGIGNQQNMDFIPEKSGILYYQATVYDRCLFMDSVEVRVIPRQEELVTEHDFPNAFSPNGDGINDELILYPVRDIRRILRMEVFDRYGNDVFVKDYTTDPDVPPVGWDG